MKVDQVEDDEFVVEVDGLNVHPDNAPSLALLKLAASFFQLVAQLSDEHKGTLSFRGLRIIDKCAGVAVHVNDVAQAQALSAEAGKLLESDRPAPKHLKPAVEGIRSARRALAPHTAKVLVGPKWAREIPLIVALEDQRMPLESTTLRLTPTRVGGKTPPKVTFDAECELDRMTVRANQQMARRIAQYLYEEIEATVEIQRDGRGVIRDGRLLAFEPVAPRTEAVGLWKDWYSRSASKWDKVKSVKRVLGRD